MNVMKRLVRIFIFIEFYFNAFFIEIKSTWSRTKNIDADRTPCKLGQFAWHRNG